MIHTSTRLGLAMLAATWLLVNGPTPAFADSAQILQDADAFRAPADSFAFDLNVVEGESSLGLEVRVAERAKSLVIYRRPEPTAGRILLMVERNMWIFVPGTQRPIRISPQQQLIGGVSSADVARTVFSLDYEVTGQAPDTVEGRPVIRLNLTAQPGAPYETMTLWVDADDHRPLRAEAFGVSGRLLKTMVFTNWQRIEGKDRPMTLLVEDKVKGSHTEMRYSNLRSEATPGTQFQPSYLPMVK